MKDISIKYRLRWPFRSFFRKVSGTFPASWDEISEAQLRAFENLHAGRVTDIQFASVFFGIPESVLQRCNYFDRYNLLNFLEFMKDQQLFGEFLMSRRYRTKLTFEGLKSPLDLMIEREENKNNV